MLFMSHIMDSLPHTCSADKLWISGRSEAELDFSSSAITASVSYGATPALAEASASVGHLVGAVEITVVQDVVIDIWRTPGILSVTLRYDMIWLNIYYSSNYPLYLFSKK